MILIQYPLFSYMFISFYDVWMYHSQRIHGTGIFTYMYHKNQPHVGKYTSPMDGMGLYFVLCPLFQSSNQILFHRRNSGWVPLTCEFMLMVLWSPRRTSDKRPSMLSAPAPKTTKPSLWNPDFVVGSLSVNDSHMDVSENRGYPQIIHFNRVFH